MKSPFSQIGIRISTMNEITIIPYRAELREDVLALAIDARTLVFERMRHEVPAFVYAAFYPQGWQARQSVDVAAMLDGEPQNISVAMRHGELAGFVGLRLHPEDAMGEVQIVAVAPRHQRQGVGRALLTLAEERMRAAGMTMVMVETEGDSGHEPARRAYEVFGYERRPVARCFKRLGN